MSVAYDYDTMSLPVACVILIVSYFFLANANDGFIIKMEIIPCFFYHLKLHTVLIYTEL